MDGHDDIAQFTPADDSIAVCVVQRKDPAKMEREQTIRRLMCIKKETVRLSIMNRNEHGIIKLQTQVSRDDMRKTVCI